MRTNLTFGPMIGERSKSWGIGDRGDEVHLVRFAGWTRGREQDGDYADDEFLSPGAISGALRSKRKPERKAKVNSVKASSERRSRRARERQTILPRKETARER